MSLPFCVLGTRLWIRRVTVAGLRHKSTNARSPFDCGLASCQYVAARLKERNPRFVLVDATWFLPNSPFACPVEGSTAAEEYAKGPRVPGARFFDIDAVSDTTTGLPHMLPPEKLFGDALANLGISSDSEVVVYDQLGVFSAPRFWFTLKAYGFQHVAVMDGGLPLWQKDGQEVETGAPTSATPVKVESWKLNENMVWSVAQVVQNSSTQDALLIDARPAARFTGSAAEPRPGMRGGHVPGSSNVPFLNCLTADRTMKDKGELAQVFADAGIEIQQGSKQPFYVTSCGSGMTACIVQLALKQVGFPIETSSAVYDGSWTEYGARSDTPIVSDGPDGEKVAVP